MRIIHFIYDKHIKFSTVLWTLNIILGKNLMIIKRDVPREMDVLGRVDFIIDILIAFFASDSNMHGRSSIVVIVVIEFIIIFRP